STVHRIYVRTWLKALFTEVSSSTISMFTSLFGFWRELQNVLRQEDSNMQKPHSTSPLSLATWQAYGYLTTDAHPYRPLDVVTVSVHGRQQGDDRALIRVCDSNQQIYFEAAIDLHENHGEVSFIVAGALGVHYIYLTWPGGKRHSRYLNFLL